MRTSTTLAGRLGLALAALAVGAVPLNAAGADADNLDHALQKHAPALIKYLRAQECRNAGVLKFLVKQGGQTLDNAGPINLSVANRLEVALVLANPDEKLGIIERASAVAARAGGRRANHLSPEGRKALFGIKEYTLAWGDRRPVEADAFLTGVVEISPDLRRLNVTVQAFGRNSKDLQTVCVFAAATDVRTLVETGRSFQLPLARGPSESELLAKAIDHSQQVSANKEKNPLETGKSPVELKVLYNGNPVPVSNGAVPEPGRDDRVSFVLVNRGTERYGVVLKVNGENTLFREPYEPLHCYKWILEPGKQAKVEGFQIDAKQLKRFEVLSPEESQKDVVHYGEHAGTFSMTVFREAKSDQEVAVASHDIAIIGRGTLAPSGKKPTTLGDLKRLLREKESKDPVVLPRGLVAPGEEVSRTVQYVSFKSEPVPLLSATIRYWQPAK